MTLAPFGIAPADAGSIRLDGRPVAIGSPREAIRRGIAYLPEERRAQGLVLSRPTGWNVSIGCLGRFSRGGFVDGRGIEAFAAASTGAVGVRGGNQQKVVLARTLALDPDIVILDEPTRGVVVGAKSDIHRIIDGLAKAGRSIPTISSELDELIAMCDRILAPADPTHEEDHP